MAYYVGVRYNKKALSWRIVVIDFVESHYPIRVWMDYERNCVMVPSFMVNRNGTWVCPRKLLNKFWVDENARREELKFNESVTRRFGSKVNSRVHESDRATVTVSGVN